MSAVKNTLPPHLQSRRGRCKRTDDPCGAKKLTICGTRVKPECCSTLENTVFHAQTHPIEPQSPALLPRMPAFIFPSVPRMLRFHIRQNLRSAFFLVVLVAAITTPVVLWKANRSGLPDSWRALIERELANQGIHLEIGAIHYLPLRGIAARDVRIFSDPEHEYELSRIGRILLDFDKAKLARGELRLNKMQLTNADVLVQSDTADPQSETLSISSVYGELLMPGGRVLEIRNARGKVGSVEVRLDARMLGYRSSGTGGLPEEDTSTRGKRREFVAVISRELERWDHPDGQNPSIRVRMDGDLTEMTAFRTAFEFEAPSMSLNHHQVENIRVSGEWIGQHLALQEIRLTDRRGTLLARADYDLKSGSGRFDGESGLDLMSLARAWFSFNAPDELLIGGSQAIRASGKFRIPADRPVPEIEAIGTFACESVMFRGVVFDRVESAFSTREGDWFFRDAEIRRTDGKASGKMMLQWPMVRIAMESTLPIPVYGPIFKDQPLEKVIQSFGTGPQSEIHLRIEGGMDATERLSWAYQGAGTVSNVTYNSVPVHSATTGFSLSHHELDFHDGILVLDTSKYPERVAHGGPTQTTTTVSRVRFINHDRMLELSGIEGSFWAPPVLALFNAELAKNISKYRFHRPPNLRASGVVDISQAGRTRLDIRFDSTSHAATEVLGEEITFTSARGNVLLNGNRVLIRGLDLTAFNGPVKASLVHEKGRLSADISWTKLDLKSLAAAYDVTIQGGGTTTGRIDFSIISGQKATLNGSGNAAFEDAHLFSVPVLGPLSPLIAAIVDDRRTGYERAKDAFLTFEIKNGVVSSDDFRTHTTNLTFTGDGKIDLNDQTVDMTMRVNARGLLGIITLPLRPFYGLFQFRGTGPVREPEWENVMFTNPPPRQREELLKPPRARIVRER